MNPSTILNELKSTISHGADPGAVHAAAQKRASLYANERGSWPEVMNAAGDNTIAPELKRTVIMQEIVKDFARRLLPLGLFSTVFRDVPLEGTNTIQVPFMDLDTEASLVFSAATGYVTTGTTTLDHREITIGQDATNGGRWYKDLAFTSEEFARQPWLKIQEMAKLKAEKLASDIVANVLSVVTEANYGTAAKTVAAAAFVSDDVADLVESCKLWPLQGRSLFLDTSYHVALLKDEGFKAAYAAGSDAAIKEGRLNPRVMGFDYVENPTIPGNSEHLVGFAAFKSAILVAFAPVPPSREVLASGVTYRIFTDPDSGVSLEYRTRGDGQLDRAHHTIESSFGWAKGNGNAIKRITSE